MQHDVDPSMTRLVQQHLESLRRAGLTHLPIASNAMTDDEESRECVQAQNSTMSGR